MSGFALSLDWDDSQLQQMVKTMVGRLQDMSPVMADYSEYMLGETMERFEKEEAPDGSGWQVLSDKTKELREKRGKSGKKLQQDGILKNSIQREHDMNSAGLASTNVEYAAIQNFGGKAGRNHKVDIPAREYLGFNEDDIEYAKNSLEGWIVSGEVGG